MSKKQRWLARAAGAGAVAAGGAGAAGERDEGGGAAAASMEGTAGGLLQEGPPVVAAGDRGRMVWARELSVGEGGQEELYVGWKLDGRRHALSSRR